MALWCSITNAADEIIDADDVALRAAAMGIVARIAGLWIAALRARSVDVHELIGPGTAGRWLPETCRAVLSRSTETLPPHARTFCSRSACARRPAATRLHPACGATKGDVDGRAALPLRRAIQVRRAGPEEGIFAIGEFGDLEERINRG